MKTSRLNQYETNFSEIGQDIINSLPNSTWTEIILFAEITDSSYELKFWAKIKGIWINCYNLMPQIKIRELFKTLYKKLLPDQKHKNWYSLTFIISKSGKFTVEYNYDDYNKFPYFYKESWKKKYLR